MLKKFWKENEDFFVYKIIDLISPLNLHFSKGVSPWFFFKKLTFLQLLFLCNMDREKVIGEGLERKRFKRALKFAFFQRGYIYDR